MKKTIIITCKRCGEKKPKEAKGYCRPCYWKVYNAELKIEAAQIAVEQATETISESMAVIETQRRIILGK